MKFAHEQPKSDEILAVMEARKPENSVSLNVDDALKFISKSVFIFPNPKSRGRTPKKDPVSHANAYSAKLRQALYYRLVRLKESRKKAALTRRKAGDPSRERIDRLSVETAINHPFVTRGRLISLVTAASERQGSKMSRKQISRILDKNIYGIIKDNLWNYAK